MLVFDIKRQINHIMLTVSTMWSCFVLGGSAKRECHKGIHRKPSAETRASGVQMSEVLQHQA